jgi:hypothetical protein
LYEILQDVAEVERIFIIVKRKRNTDDHADRAWRYHSRRRAQRY